MTNSERITIRLSAEEMIMIQKLVNEGYFDSITSLVRFALDEFLGKHYSPDYVKKITVDLPKGNVVKLENLVKEGEAISIDDAIRNAVREYTRSKVLK